MIDTLYRIIDDNNIVLIEKDLALIDPALKGLYFDNIIVLDKKIDTCAERACILAEEIGHHFTTVGNILDQSDLRKEKEEEKARRWATKIMIEPQMFIDAFNAGVCNRWELSQYLNMTEAFIEDSLTYIKKLYGPMLTIDGYTICFDPLWVYKSFE